MASHLPKNMRNVLTGIRDLDKTIYFVVGRSRLWERFEAMGWKPAIPGQVFVEMYLLEATVRKRVARCLADGDIVATYTRTLQEILGPTTEMHSPEGDGMPEFSIIGSSKTVSETLADLRKLFRQWEVEDFEPVPGEDGRSYAVRYLRGGVWMEVASALQPTKAQNLRVCYQVIHYFKLWGERGVTGLAQGVSVIGGLVPTNNREKRESFDEACATLGVDPETSWDEIQRLWQIKVQYAHPDKGGDAERFKRIQKAYELVKKVKGAT